MGKRSIRENKNMYQLYREAAGFTREKAAERMAYVSEDRIEKIELEKSAPHPDEVLAMSLCYKKPELCNQYCTMECPVGKETIPVYEPKDFARIALEILTSVTVLEKKKDRLIEIAADGVIDQNETEDFSDILMKLDEISRSVGSLRLWIAKQQME